MELSPVLGLADQKVETITDISSRLIINKGAMKMKNDLVKPMIEKLIEVVEAK